ncbi:MAG: hypothetical protein ACOYXT_22955 [Bacteroidota bacterium]
MTRAIIVILGFCLVLGACTQRMICPAYQSAFIYDKDQLRKKFSYFADDSTPKVFTASKNKYLIAEPTSYRKKIRSMQTVQLKQVPVHVPDSLTGDSVSTAELDAAARSVIDSTFIVDIPQDSVASAEDSVYVITKDKEIRILKYDAPDSLKYDPTTQKYLPETPKYYVTEVGYNTEQDNYMWYLRDNLVLPDVRLARLGQNGEGKGGGKAAKAGKKKKGFFGFFKNLFKKKKKQEPDSTQQPPPPKEEFDFIDSDTVAHSGPDMPAPAKEKKGLFGRKKTKKADPIEVGDANTSKKKKSKKADVQPEDKKKDEGDGF